MKRLKKQRKSTAKKAEEILEAAKIYSKIGAKQIIGHSRIVPAGGAAINTYHLEDGSKVFEDDAGGTLPNGVVVYKRRVNEEVKQNV